MSVINKVLKDLDRRGQQPFSKNTASSAVERPNRSRISLWLFGVVVLSILVVVLVWWPLPGDQVMTVRESGPSAPLTPKKQVKPKENTTVVKETAALIDSAEPIVRREQRSEPQVLGQQAPSARPEPSPEPESAEANTAANPPTAATQENETTSQNSGEFSLEPVQLSPEEIARQHINKARKAQQQGRLTAAEEHWRKALSATPGNKEVRKRLAALQFGRNKVTQALITLEAGFQMAPTDYEFRLLSARILEKEARPAAALSLLKQAIPDAKIYPEYFQKQALLAQEVGDYQSAAQAYQQLIEVDPTEGRWYLGKAIAQQRFAPNAALTSYQKALTRIEHKPTLDFIEQQIGLLTTKNQAGKE